MTRRVAAAALAALLLAGCPLPQPLPDYPKGTVTPPRILADEVTVNGDYAAGEPIVKVPVGCTGTAPSYVLAARLFDSNNLEQVEARWFVDYQATTQRAPFVSYPPASADQSVFTRDVTPFTFMAYDQGTTPAAGEVHVVELVVSNGFATDGGALPYRSPAQGFETAVYRWVFLYVDQSAAGAPACP
ncbi:hypothetical protein [Anaeromyxobacter oryzisoli]|uniref:hypothetical protein n=1 Tax=Anaeromyxobacter oryzisoli TaxID=2925408 RepID=UPI001F56FE9A|nr:hypothetical protein [Anaeromyxobacter sp. SG63]